MTKETDQEQYHVGKLYEEYQPRLKNYINKHGDGQEPDAGHTGRTF